MFYEDRCTACGECLEWCPYMEIGRDRSREEFERLLKGQPSKVASKCVSCMGCDEICPEGANPFSLIVKRQEEQGEAAHFEMGRKYFEEACALPSEVKKGDEDGPVIDICRFYDFNPRLFEGILFKGATLIKGGDYYCGFGFYHIAMPSRVEERVHGVVERVAKTGAEEVVCYHDDCYSLFKVRAPELGVDVPFRPVSWPEFLYKRMTELEDRIKPLNKTLAYQRPCSSRYTPKKDRYIPKIIDLMGGTMPPRIYEGEQALCCAKTIERRDFSLSEKIKDMNLDDARGAGAEILITLCPICFSTLIIKGGEYGLSVVPLGELCRAALGEVKLTTH